MSFTFQTIAIIHSCYKQKFAIPRQSGLVTEAQAQIELIPPYNHPDMLKGLEGFSHIWLTFVFDKHHDKGYKNLVSPPRLNGADEYGVFATRSPYRPNPIGLSVVELVGIESQQESIFLNIKGADLLDKTPIIDIKPYIDYADSIKDTRSGFTTQLQGNNFNIQFSHLAEADVLSAQKSQPNIRRFILQLLSQDPRPHYTTSIKSHYCTKIYNYDLHWDINGKEIEVTSLDKLY